MDFSISSMANKYAIQQVPAAQGQENAPQIVQSRSRHAFNWKVTAFNAASATLISCVVLSVLVSFKLFFLIGAAAFLARRSIMKDLTIENQEPDNNAYKDMLHDTFGISNAETDAWNKYNPVQVNVAGYHILMGAPLLPAAPANAVAQAPAQQQQAAPAQANAAPANAVAQAPAQQQAAAAQGNNPMLVPA